MYPTEVKMDDLPILPFGKILSYLSLQDRIRSRAVSRRWCRMIDSFRVRSLFFSSRQCGFIKGKSRLMSGAFAQNFIGPARFEAFFNTFGQSILSNLKHLRLCKLNLNNENKLAFVRTLNSFGRLEELSLFCFDLADDPEPRRGIEFELNLPMLNSIRLESVLNIEKLTLNAPRLQKIKLSDCSLSLDLIHGASVERLITSSISCTEVKELKNLKYLYTYLQPEIDSTLLSSLEHLKELHLHLVGRDKIPELFEQKQRYGSADLKIYLYGCLLDGPKDPAIDSFGNPLDQAFTYLLENCKRLGDEIPFSKELCYSAIERAPESAVNVLKRFVDLDYVILEERVQDTERFLDLLKSFDNIVGLEFWSDQPQDLFDRLPDCAVQQLVIFSAPLDLRFLVKLGDLIHLHLDFSIDADSIRKILEELHFLSSFKFKHFTKSVRIEISNPKLFEISVRGKGDTIVTDVGSAIRFIIETTSTDGQIN